MSAKEYIIGLLIMAVLGVVGYVWRSKRQEFRLMLTGYIQQLESAVTGSKMGPTRKQMLLDILAAAEIKVPAWADAMIDSIVQGLNKNRAWITEFAGGGLPAIAAAENSTSIEDVPD